MNNNLQPLSSKSADVLDGIVRGMVQKFKEGGGVAGGTMPRYVFNGAAPIEAIDELVSGGYAVRAQGGVCITVDGLRSRSGLHTFEHCGIVFNYFG